MKLALVTPWSSPFIWTKFTQNLTELLLGFDRDGYELAFFMGKGVDPAARHVNMCLQALEWGADLICIIGADQIHPPDMLNRLVDRWEEYDGVWSALVPFRGYVSWQHMKPFQPMGWRLRTDGVEEVGRLEDNPQQWEPIDPEAGDVQRVDVIGSGVLLFHRDHLLALRKPWWYYRVDPETMQRVADMDTRMVWRLRSEAGAIVYVDTTIKVKHLHTFEIDDSFQDRFMDWMDPTLTTDDIAQYHERKE